MTKGMIADLQFSSEISFVPHIREGGRWKDASQMTTAHGLFLRRLRELVHEIASLDITEAWFPLIPLSR